MPVDPQGTWDAFTIALDRDLYAPEDDDDEDQADEESDEG